MSPPHRFSLWSGAPVMVGDSFSNFLSGLGVYGRDKVASQVPSLRELSAKELADLYRGDWLSRKICDIPAFDACRSWRRWNAEKNDIQAIESSERAFGLQRKVMEAFVRARLFGGAAIVLGVEGAGEWNEELDLDKVKKGSLKFIHVVTGGRLPMIAAGPLVRDVTSPWFGQPSYYQRSNIPVLPAPGNVEAPPALKLGRGPESFAFFIHPSRVVRLTGLDYPDMETSPDPWGDSVLQPVWDAIRDAGLVGQSVANLATRANVNVINVPGLTQKLATTEGTRELIARFTNANVAQSVVNALLLDVDEKWQQLQVRFEQLPQVVQMYLLIGAAAADIPSTRLLSREPAGMNATGDSDTRNYYDRLSSDQKVRITPLLAPLDEVLIRHALGRKPDGIDYSWNPLWQLDGLQKADINLKNAQAFKIDNDSGLIDPIALKKGRENQLIADEVYPGLDEAINKAEQRGERDDDIDDPVLDADTEMRVADDLVGGGAAGGGGGQSALGFSVAGGGIGSARRKRRRPPEPADKQRPDPDVNYGPNDLRHYAANDPRGWRGRRLQRDPQTWESETSDAADARRTGAAMPHEPLGGGRSSGNADSDGGAGLSDITREELAELVHFYHLARTVRARMSATAAYKHLDRALSDATYQGRVSDYRGHTVRKVAAATTGDADEGGASHVIPFRLRQTA